jgi:hypothetical protein
MSVRVFLVRDLGWEVSMPTSVSVNKPPSPHDWAKALAKGGIVVLVAVGLVCLAVGTIYLRSAVGLDLQDRAALVIDPGR